MSSSAALAGGSVSTIPVICGPTASGKSAIAMWIAQRREITIISADSRQVYRRFDIGTAKPSGDDRRRVPHRGIDVAEPTVRSSAAEWTDLARDAIAEAFAAGRIPVVVGGTGFYIGSLFRPLWAQPELDESRRAGLQRALEGETIDELRRWCDALDPSRSHLGRAQLLRAIEVALLTGARLSEMHVSRSRPSAYVPSYLLVDPGSELSQRIASRVAGMLDAGWLDEVRGLIESVPEQAPAWNAAGYELVRSHVRGEIERDAMLERVVIETRQYAKRQRTWFRHQLENDRVQRLVPGASGWQETVDRWITDVERAMHTVRGSSA